MKFSFENDKIGKAIIVSRAVGDTCPSTCDYLHNGCYAEKTERLFKNARKVGLANIVTDYNKIRSMLVLAVNKNLKVRIHERGDFLYDGKLDKQYIQNWRKACLSLDSLPSIWTYTHVYSKYLVNSLSEFVTMYASVHSQSDYRKAVKAGFTKFAWCDNGTYGDYHRNGKTVAPKVLQIGKEKFHVCPEQLYGRAKVTCTGTKRTKACNLCIQGKKNVLFVQH